MVEIEWASSAEIDLNEILDYIAQDSPQYALTFYDLIQEKLENLKEFPRIGRNLPRIDDFETREIIIGSYRLIYRIIEEKIQIIRIIHGARDLKI